MPCHATYSPVVRPSIAAVRARLLPVIVPFRSSSSRRPSLRRQAPPPAAPAAAVVVPLPLLLLALPPDALAVNGELGILEGRSVALLHPLVMGALFAYTLWAGYLGWQWRRVRTLQDDINALKTQQLTTPKPPAAVEAEIERLAEERRRLLKGSFRDRHFDAGSILLGLGVLESVGGALDTWFRNGQLFPEPHLFAGAAITVLWEAAAALVPPICRRGTRRPGTCTSCSTRSTSCSSCGRSPPAWTFLARSSRTPPPPGHDPAGGHGCRGLVSLLSSLASDRWLLE